MGPSSTKTRIDMRAFGLELRKIGSRAELFSEVDRTLNKAGIVSPGQVSADMKVGTVAHALNKMMKVESHFSVCTIRECARLCQVNISSERMNVYSSIHCMNWNDMMEDYRQTIVAMVLDDFRTVLSE